METLRKKWNSSRGASILMALLFLLVCMMVGASILMAAVSNAGKLKSNREEQQKYLTLSSALNLICDELTSATYSGDVESKPVTVPAVTGEGGIVISPSYTYTEYTQKPGKITQGSPVGSDFELNEVLPLRLELDRLFAETFPSSGGGLYQDDDKYYPLADDKTAPLTEHELKLTVDTPNVEGLSGEKNQVTIRLKMERSHSIGVTATLGKPDEDGYVYTMKAWLVSSGEKPNMKEKKAGSLSWTVDWIVKG